MTSFRRNIALRTFAVGAALTFGVILLDCAQYLVGIERALYDWRALHFQHFSPPPTDRMVHLDVDDSSIETVGRWPWPRSTQAEIIDEVRLAGADFISLDIILSEPQPLGVVERPDGQTNKIDHDANFAAAIGRFRHVMVPMSVVFDPPPARTPQYVAALAELTKDLQISRAQLSQRLPPDLGRLVDDDLFLAARREATTKRIQAELADGLVGPAEMQHRLLPRSDEGESASIRRQFDTQYWYCISMVENARFGRSHPAGAPPLLDASDAILPIPAIAHEAGHSGFANYLPLADGAVRVVPLWVQRGDKVYPQMDLAVACAVLGADVRNATIGEHEVTIPRLAGGEPIVIPVRRFKTSQHGEVGAMFDIPWYGTRDWATMYDVPNHRERKQHIPIAQAWGLAESRKAVVSTNSQIGAEKGAIPFFADAGLDSAKSFMSAKHPPDDVAAWAAGLEPVLRDAKELASSLEGVPADQLTDQDKYFLNHFGVLQRALADNQKLLGKSQEMHKLLAGKTVFVGSTATSMFDEMPTALHGSCPGVVIHGVIFNAIVTGQFWHTAPTWVTYAITLILGLLITVVVAGFSPWKALIATLFLTGGYLLLNCIALFDYGNRIVGLAGPLTAAAAVWGALTLMRFIIESAERARITRRFQRYVDPGLVKYVIEHPELARLEGEQREMTVCFTDLVGYTSLTEKLRERAVKILGRYKGLMVPVIRAHRGMVHCFMGDGIMFSYGAPVQNPNHAADAVAAVFEMQIALEKLNDELVADGYSKLGMRAGISTGMVIVGDSGADDASDYACLGNTTNLGARLESANKAIGTKIMMSDRTVELLNGKYLVRPIGRLRVVGKTEGVMTFEPMVLAKDATPEQERLAVMTREMVNCFIEAKFADCISAADRLDEAFGISKLSRLYRDLSTENLATPTVDFQGHIVLREK